MKSKDGKSNRTSTFVQPVILKLLVTWLANCPNAVHCFLDSRPHLTYLLELISSEYATVCTRGLAAILLGECTLYNNSSEHAKDSFSIVDAISQKIGLTAYLLKFDEMQRSNVFSSSKTSEPRKPLTRSNASSMVDFEDMDDGDSHDKSSEDNPFLSFIFNDPFIEFIKGLEEKIRESIVEVYSHPKSEVAVVPAELERKNGESDMDYIERLKSFVEKQCTEIQVRCIPFLCLVPCGMDILLGVFSYPSVMDEMFNRVCLDAMRRWLRNSRSQVEVMN